MVKLILVNYKMRRFLGFFGFTMNYSEEELDYIKEKTLEGFSDPGLDSQTNKSYSWGRTYVAFMNAGLSEKTAKIEADRRFGYEVRTLN